MKKTIAAMLAIILLSFILAVSLYQKMPEQMASHWNSQGHVDDYMPRFWGLFLMPIVTIAMFLVFLLIPKIDPLKKNIEKFRNYYNWFILLIIVFMLYIYILTIAWNLGYRFDMSVMMVPALGILFFYAGVLMENAKRNWFIGLRTPWTLSSDVVWKKTNRLGGKLFKAAGIIAVLSLFIPKYAMLIIIIPVMFFAIYLIFYSYFEYQKETKKRKKIR